jgi:hypothetical protein
MAVWSRVKKMKKKTVGNRDNRSYHTGPISKNRGLPSLTDKPPLSAYRTV